MDHDTEMEEKQAAAIAVMSAGLVALMWFRRWCRLRREGALRGRTKTTLGKRARERDVEVEAMKRIASQIGEIAIALKTSRSLQFDTDLFSEVMKLESEGFDKKDLDKAFDYLLENDALARGFLVKAVDLRVLWMQDFLASKSDHIRGLDGSSSIDFLC